jgi:hypothetical protein
LRWLVVAILLAAAGGVAYLLSDGEGPGERNRNRQDGVRPERNGGVVAPPGVTKPLPEPEEKSLAGFVAACRERGEEAVPLILRRLREKQDRRFDPLWRFEDGKLQGYPTLRSVYIAALAAIPGESAALALQQILPEARSPGEAYQIALELDERGFRGWSEALLARAGEGTAADRGLRMEMAEFAAREDPAGTTAHVLQTAPRGDSNEDGRVLATAVTHLPFTNAVVTAGHVLDDPEITTRAKSAMLRSVLRRRPETEVFSAFEEQIVRGRLDDKLKIDAAYAAANSIWFVNDIKDYEGAAAAGDGAKADEIRRRFNERMRAARSLIRTAVGEGDEARAKAMIRILDAHQARMDKR